jgi:hypothetical protein
MSTTIVCERCGHEDPVTLTMEDGEEITGEEYAAWHHAAGLMIVCDRCAVEFHDRPQYPITKPE